MLKQMDVLTRRGTLLSFDMFENNSGYQIAEVEGLDPVKATLVSSSYAGRDGAQFQSAARGPRNLKIKLDLQPDGDLHTYTSLRQQLYSFFMPKSEIKMRFFKTSGLYLDIVGVVEDVTAPMFSDDPDVEVLVTCFEPDLLDPRTVLLAGSTVATGTNTAINYPGTVEAGTVLTLNINRNLSDFTVYNTGEDGILQKLDFSGTLLNGDQLIISSVSGAKGITLIRSGTTSSYLYGRTAQSSWITLSEGINNFRVYTPGDPIPYQLQYTVRYGAL